MKTLFAGSGRMSEISLKSLTGVGRPETGPVRCEAGPLWRVGWGPVWTRTHAVNPTLLLKTCNDDGLLCAVRKCWTWCSFADLQPYFSSPVKAALFGHYCDCFPRCGRKLRPAVAVLCLPGNDGSDAFYLFITFFSAAFGNDATSGSGCWDFQGGCCLWDSASAKNYTVHLHHQRRCGTDGFGLSFSFFPLLDREAHLFFKVISLISSFSSLLLPVFLSGHRSAFLHLSSCRFAWWSWGPSSCFPSPEPPLCAANKTSARRPVLGVWAEGKKRENSSCSVHLRLMSSLKDDSDERRHQTSDDSNSSCHVHSCPV